MSIVDKIEYQWLCFVAETGRQPLHLYLGYQDLAELDHKLGMITFRYKSMDVISVSRESHISCGNTYSEQTQGY